MCVRERVIERIQKQRMCVRERENERDRDMGRQREKLQKNKMVVKTAILKKNLYL